MQFAVPGKSVSLVGTDACAYVEARIFLGHVHKLAHRAAQRRSACNGLADVIQL